MLAHLAAIDMTSAQKGDARNYGGDEVIQFFRNSGMFKAGDRVKAGEMLPHLKGIKPTHFAVYEERTLNLARGDAVCITGNGWDKTGKHCVDNGRLDEISGFTPEGDLMLSNGWVIAKDFGHLKPGLVSTSDGSQSKTFDVVLAAMNRASSGATSHPQGYVTISRGRERGMIVTDMRQNELLELISREDRRKSATELMRRPEAEGGAKAWDRNWWKFMEKVRTTYRQWRRKVAEAVREPLRERGMSYAR